MNIEEATQAVARLCEQMKQEHQDSAVPRYVAREWDSHEKEWVWVAAFVVIHKPKRARNEIQTNIDGYGDTIAAAVAELEAAAARRSWAR